MSPTSRKALLMLVAALIALIVAIVTAWLVLSTGVLVQIAILSSGAAFGSTLTLIILVLDKAGGLA